MKTIFNIPDEKAAKELRMFAPLGLAFSLISIVALGFLAVVGLAFSARALVLSLRKVNKEDPEMVRYRVMAVLGLVAGLLSMYLGLTA
ncbi:hypothetical protein CR970_03340 [Candidatus Saccharibacteria bacterium]|nr:MAG: hypothetical protein CR970_03340 [Candidatus Saccharibacteria bacterium]